MNVVLRKYFAADLEDCVSVLADAFVSSPLHLSAFGKDGIDQNRRFFRLALRNMFFGQAFVALVDGALCGYVISEHGLIACRRRRKFLPPPRPC
jgi:hypothetical protein